MTSPKFPEPPPSAPPTSIADCDAAVARLKANRAVWVNTPISDRIALLRRSIQATLDCAEDWVAAACKAKGISAHSPRAGEEWLGGPMTVIRNMRLLVTALEQQGQPQVPSTSTRPDGQVVARVFPGDIFDKAMFGGVTGDVWIEPGKPASQGRIYREKAAGTPSAGAVSLVLGAGNVASIGPMDALYKLFAEDEVVVIKSNPVNAYLGPFWEKSLAPFIEKGFVAVVHGGADVGVHLCNHPDVETIHMTGSDRTYDAIVWGATPDEQARNKAANTPINSRRVSAELGSVTPVLVVPGEWSESDIVYQARHVAGMVVNNASFNCNAAKVLVTAKGWPHRDRFVSELNRVLATIPPRKAYYPGANQRYDAFVSRYPQATPLGERHEGVVPWTFIPNVAASPDEYALTNEAFCGVLAHVELDTADAASFLREGVRFANDTVWGSLSMMMLIDDRTRKAHAAEFDKALADLRFGGIGVNVWAGLIYGLVCTTWGAYPGHPPTDIRSGAGVVHNTYLFDNPQKSVVQAPFRIFPTPVWFGDHKTQHEVGRKMTSFEAAPGFLKLPSIVYSALRG